MANNRLFVHCKVHNVGKMFMKSYGCWQLYIQDVEAFDYFLTEHMTCELVICTEYPEDGELTIVGKGVYV
jgi:hypothetical protein